MKHKMILEDALTSFDRVHDILEDPFFKQHKIQDVTTIQKQLQSQSIDHPTNTKPKGSCTFDTTTTQVLTNGKFFCVKRTHK